MAIILTGRVPPQSLIPPHGRPYDTFTEVVEIVDKTLSTLWGEFDNVAIVTGRKQARRASVMLDTLRSVDDRGERQRLDRYFKVYMPQRLADTSEARVHEAFTHYKAAAYKNIVPKAALLKRKNFIIVPSEDITGVDLGEDEELERSSQGVQDWLDGIYGHEYLQPQRPSSNEVVIVARHISAPANIPRRHIPFAATAQAKKKGIGWGISNEEP